MILFLFAAILLGVLLGFAPHATRFLCRKGGLVKPNFTGAVIPAALGITFLLVCCPVYAILLLFGSPVSMFPPFFVLAYLLTTAGFGMLGLADDLWGSRTVGGFKGHIKAALQGKPTTGGAKLLGGGLCALAAAYLVRHATMAQDAAFSPAFLGAIVIDAGVVALAANALNLLDVRPGRAGFGFAVLASVAALGTLGTVCAAANGENASAVFALFAPVVLAALRETLPDARANGMMGDTGSNLLGASAGLACVVALPLGGRVVLLLALLALNGGAERVSLSALIAKTPLLARLDKRLGVRS